MDFLQTSIDVQKKLGMKTRAKLGIFFTPKPLRDILFEHIGEFIPKTILEPSCGSGEFINDCENKYPNASITGIELNEELIDIAKQNVKNAEIINHDFLSWNGGKYDLIVGNPPFCKLLKKDSKYPSSFVHSSNLYIEFLYKCITEHLNPSGILAMVIPCTIQNGTNSQPTRDIILSKKIIHFETIRDHAFKDTKAGVSILVLQNTSGDDAFNFQGFLTDKYIELKQMIVGYKKFSEYDLYYQCGNSVGKLKEFYSDDPDDILYILTGDLKQNEITFDEEKRLFIKKDVGMKTYSGRCVMLLRTQGVSMGKQYKLMFSYFEHNNFMFEGCMIMMTGRDIDILYKSLSDERTEFYLRNLVGSGRLTKQLVYNMPIFE